MTEKSLKFWKQNLEEIFENSTQELGRNTRLFLLFPLHINFVAYRFLCALITTEQRA